MCVELTVWNDFDSFRFPLNHRNDGWIKKKARRVFCILWSFVLLVIQWIVMSCSLSSSTFFLYSCFIFDGLPSPRTLVHFHFINYLFYWFISFWFIIFFCRWWSLANVNHNDNNKKEQSDNVVQFFLDCVYVWLKLSPPEAAVVRLLKQTKSCTYSY